MTGSAPAPRFGQYYFTRKTATAYELYIFGGETAEFARGDPGGLLLTGAPARRSPSLPNDGGPALWGTFFMISLD